MRLINHMDYGNPDLDEPENPDLYESADEVENRVFGSMNLRYEQPEAILYESGRVYYYWHGDIVSSHSYPPIDVENYFSSSEDRYAFAGMDTLENIENLGGSNFDDMLIGDDQANHLSGYDGYDMLFGKGGDDWLSGGSGSDEIYGGEGSDTVMYHTSSEGVTVDLLYGYTSDGDMLESIENVSGSEYADTLTGNEEVNSLYGRGGDDILTGHTGSDKLFGGAGNDTYIYRAGDGEDIIEDSEGLNTIWFEGDFSSFSIKYATISNGESLEDPDGQDLLITFSDTDTILLKNGRNIDGFSYEFDEKIYTHAQLLAMIGTVEQYGEEDDTIRGSEANDTIYAGGGADSVYGNDGNDVLYGEAGRDYLRGDAGNDTLLGGTENDTLIGGAGADILDGGEGRDRADYRSSDEAVNINLATGEVSGGEAEGDTLTSIENIGGSAFNDTLTGNDENNSLYGNNGDDLLSGNGGNDWIRGGAGTDTLNGGAGNDTLIGGTGADILDGGEGRDKADYRYSDAAVNVDIAANTASGGDAEGDTLSSIENIGGSAFNDTLTGNDENNSLYGNNGDDLLSGNGGNDWIRGGAGTDTLNGGAGNDTLIGGTGADILDGGEGRDKADYRYSDAAVNVNLAANTASGGDAEGDSFSSIENIVGSAFNDTLTGNDENNSLYGNNGDDLLSGNGGNDWMRGGAGTDTLNGGAGNDTLIGGTGADILDGRDGRDKADYRYSDAAVNVNLAANTASGGNAEGDTFSSIENIGGSAFNDTLTGNDEDNSLYGNDGDDILSGGAGRDYIQTGNGNDTIVFNTALDAATNRDTISDFTTGQDTLLLDNSVFSALVDEGVLSVDNFRLNATGVAVAEHDYILYNTTTGVLSYDADGNGIGAAVDFAKLGFKPEIKAGDIMIAS